jgi:lipopolysaccharide/colanic/teichoic acid biosynthesis glycosyltransferase
LARLVRRLALRCAERTFVASPAIAAALAADGLVETKRAQLPIGCDVGLMTLPPGRTAMLLEDNPELGGRQTIVWAGTFDHRRNLAALVDLAVAMQTAAPHACLVLCGDGPTRAEIIRLIHARGLPESSLRTLSPLSRARVCELMSAAAAVLAVPTDDDTSSDFFDGLAAGKPVLFFGDGWQRTLLESRGAGFALPTGDMTLAAREIADILQDADGLRRAGQQASALAMSRFNLDRLIAEARVGMEALIAAAPRGDILRRRTLTAKRSFDVVASALGLLVLSPVALILAVLIGFKLGWPVVVTQDRTGMKGHPFRLFKFRTLLQARDAGGALLSENERLTPFGRFLRRTSLDEIPTLLNVLRGDMSLVGPRPYPTDYANYYTAAQKRRHDLRPGLTGWAQIDTGERTWDQKFARDLEYVDRISLGMDARILARTLLIVLRGRELNPPGQPLMPRFDEMMARREGAEDI